MGVYLSSPVTEKESVNEACPKQGFCYGASSMQGWRISQEDAHNCIPLFDAKTKTSFFAVYDGHGGSEVAKYCELHFPDFVKKVMESSDYLDAEPTKFIQSAFLGFDETLTTDDVIKQLKVLAGKEDDLDEDEEDENVYRNETDLLKEEATMPLDQLLAQYSSSADKGALKENVSNTAECSSSSAENGPQSSVDKPSSSSSVSPLTSNTPSSSSSSSSHVNNGKNNVSESASTEGSSATVEGSTNNNCESSTSTSSPIALSSSSATVDVKESKVDKKMSEIAAESSPTVSSSTTSSSNKAGSSSKHSDGPSGCSGSGSKSTSGVRSSKAKAAADIAKVGADSDDDDDDDDDEEEEEDMWEDLSEDDDDDDDDDDDGEGEQEEDVPMMDTSDEEPGSDSGCTACVLLKQGNKLIVANSGDSRCVLAREGKAIDLSFDHKPEDEPEKTRIEKAGGKVTADGRVNGGLNLSRAIGDHVYKRNTEVSAQEQMITALPDVQMEELGDKDQFIVIACDGIWNYMSSQEVVDYVLTKLKDPVKRKQPSIICEEMFDHCLAPNTYGDGTGCDNMTCIIIVLDTFHNSEVDGNNEEALDQNSDVNTAPVKRGLDDVDDTETKRQKVEEDGV